MTVIVKIFYRVILRSVVDVENGVDDFQVIFYRALGDEKNVGDFFVGFSLLKIFINICIIIV